MTQQQLQEIQTITQIAAAIESLLFVSGRPLEYAELRKLLDIDDTSLTNSLQELAHHLESQGRGIRLQRLGGQVQLVTAPENARYVAALLGLPMTAKLTTAAMETLAVVSYRQPATRAQIEAIRGVNSDRALASLIQHGLAAEIARQIGCNAIQIFTSNPRSWQPTADDAMDCAAFAKAARDYDLDPVVIHAPYLINLASPDEMIWQKSIHLLRWTLQRGALLEAHYVIFHTGSHRGSGLEAGVARIVEAITAILAEIKPAGNAAIPLLLLENDVGGGNSLGHDFEHLGAVLDRLPQYSETLGVCLDTAHLD